MQETEQPYFEAVYKTLEAYASITEPTEDRVVGHLVDHGIPPLTAEKLAVLVPLAFGRILIAHITAIEFPVGAILRSRNGTEKVCDLRKEPIFLAALESASNVYHNGPRDLFEPAASFSPEVACVNDALHANSSLEGAIFAEPRFFRLTYEDWIQEGLCR